MLLLGFPRNRNWMAGRDVDTWAALASTCISTASNDLRRRLYFFMHARQGALGRQTVNGACKLEEAFLDQCGDWQRRFAFFLVSRAGECSIDTRGREKRKTCGMIVVAWRRTLRPREHFGFSLSAMPAKRGATWREMGVVVTRIGVDGVEPLQPRKHVGFFLVRHVVAAWRRTLRSREHFGFFPSQICFPSEVRPEGKRA